MDTGSTINRLDSKPAAASSASAVSGPAVNKAADTATPDAASAVTETTKAAAAAPSKAEVKKSVDAINRFLEDNSEVRFSIDDASGRSIVKVIDTETKKVLQQFPSEQSLEIGKNLTSLKGLLIDSK